MGIRVALVCGGAAFIGAVLAVILLVTNISGALRQVDGALNHAWTLGLILAGGGLKHRGHVVCPAEDHKRIPLGNLWLSALQWFGLKTDRFNKSTGTFSAMEIG